MNQFDTLFPINSVRFMAGFECTYAQTTPKERLDMMACTKHDEYADRDYKMIKKIGIRIVREGLAWNQIDKGDGNYDFSRFVPMMETAASNGMDIIWDLNHFDYPSDVDPFSDTFVKRFEQYSKHAWEVLRKHTSGPLTIIPINEISFMAWIGADRGWWAPFKKGPANGLRLKKQLVRAALAAMKAIWQLDKEVVFIHSDPFMKRMAISPHKKVREAVDAFNNVIRFEAWDMLCGKTYPELGGSPEFLPVVGVNYYVHNQEYVWQENRQLKFQAMPWDSADRITIAQMLDIIQERYRVPLLITETGSFDTQRFRWWERTLRQVNEALDSGIDIRGVCAYPILDRPKDVNYLLPRSGLWDFDGNDCRLHRKPENKSLKLIEQFIQRHTSHQTSDSQRDLSFRQTDVLR